MAPGSALDLPTRLALLPAFLPLRHPHFAPSPFPTPPFALPAPHSALRASPFPHSTLRPPRSPLRTSRHPLPPLHPSPFPLPTPHFAPSPFPTPPFALPAPHSAL